jgi:glycosyltransferase involved in cell wall biosynthesis
MAIGLPVVTTPVSGIPEVVQDGRSGLLVPPRDPEALAVAIERLLGDAKLRRALGEGAREALADRSLERCVTGLRSLFGAESPRRAPLQPASPSPRAERAHGG